MSFVYHNGTYFEYYLYLCDIKIKLMKSIAISTREFRDNQRKYMDLADIQERIIIQRGRNKAYLLVPIQYADDAEYLLSNEANRKHLLRSIEQGKNGKTTLVNLEDLWK